MILSSCLAGLRAAEPKALGAKFSGNVSTSPGRG